MCFAIRKRLGMFFIKVFFTFVLHSNYVFRGEKDVKALYGISYDDSTLMNAKKHALGNGTLRAYSSSENIADEEIDSVQPDQVIRIYKADHTSKYFVIYQVYYRHKLYMFSVKNE